MTLKPFVHDKVVNHLALICRHQDLPPGVVSWELTQFPVEVVLDIINELRSDGWKRSDRLLMLELLSFDPRPAVKRLIAKAIRVDIRRLPVERAYAVLSRLSERARPAASRPN